LIKHDNIKEAFLFFETLKFFKFCENFRVFVNRWWSQSVPNKHKTFIQSGRGTKNPRKRFTLLVHRLKNYGPLNSQATGKGKKNSNFNEENFVVMLIYWGTIMLNIYNKNSVQYNNKASNGKIGQNVNTAVYHFFCSLFSC
jgi:hypothetical protein